MGRHDSLLNYTSCFIYRSKGALYELQALLDRLGLIGFGVMSINDVAIENEMIARNRGMLRAWIRNAWS